MWFVEGRGWLSNAPFRAVNQLSESLANNGSEENVK